MNEKPKWSRWAIGVSAIRWGLFLAIAGNSGLSFLDALLVAFVVDLLLGVEMILNRKLLLARLAEIDRAIRQAESGQPSD